MSSADNDFGNSFAERLREMMGLRKLTQQSLADAVGVSQATVFKWLNGTLPRSGELYRLAKFLGKPMEWMMEGTPAAPMDKYTMNNVPMALLRADQIKEMINKDMGMSMDQFYEAIEALKTNPILGRPNPLEGLTKQSKKKK